ncbi:amyloid beta A4 precursor protein-binding family B member 1-interacting protein-like [Engraulis encrasicolus]|uniref:amyloid beta A4 precursor protein-binding family B member 1-interacting protein-like n=1 Tax=Engraulis encrasicolus TaxID=184585 RepID=UPI002FCEAAE5
MADMDDLFGDLMDQMDLLSQSIEEEAGQFQSSDTIDSIGFTNLNAQSLGELEESDLDTLVALLNADLNVAEARLNLRSTSPQPPMEPTISGQLALQVPSPHQATEIEVAAQKKAEKIKMALEKLKEAKIKKLIIKVLLSDGSSKTLMVDDRQTTRDVLDYMFEKSHCDCSEEWGLCETNPHLQIDRAFEDHERLVDYLSTWSRDTENQLHFQRRLDKYAIFREPQMFYSWKKKETGWSEKQKQYLIKESFQGPSVSVPDLEGALFLKERGKRTWKRRYFMLRASGIYYVQKGKTKLSSDLACFIQFEQVDVYYSHDYKHKYRAPTNFCFVLKHPQIQKESDYIRILCCDDEHSLGLWVTSIRVAKYGQQLYRNYQTAVQRASRYTTGNGQLSQFTTPGIAASAVKSSGNHAVTPCSLPEHSPPQTRDQTQSQGPGQAEYLEEDGLDEPPPDFVPPSPPRQHSKSSL